MTRETGAGWLADGLGGHVKVCEECGEQFGGRTGSSTAPIGRPDVTRCPACRRRRLAVRNERMLAAYATGAFGPSPPKAPGPASDTDFVYGTVCAACGRPARVPFRPRDDRPVYCRSCHGARRGR